MELDPNIAYKRAFAELESELGHSPTPRDDGWLRLGNEYSRSWAPAEETLIKPSQRRRPEQEGFSRQQAPQALSLDTRARAQTDREPLSGPRIIPTREEAESVPEPPAAAPGVSQSLTVGSRGPAGGIVAECRKCGGVWERPKQRGKPAALCGECR